MPTRTSQRKAAIRPAEVPSPPPLAAAPSGMTRRSKRVVESVSPEPEPETVEPSDEEDAIGEDEEVFQEEDEDEGEDMEIDDEYLLDETTAPTPDETPTPTTPAAPTTSGIKLKLTLNGKNKNISGSSSSTTTTTTTTTPNITNAEAGASTSGRTGARGKRPATGKADAAAFEDDASQASVGTSKGKSTRASKRVKLDVSSEKEDASDRDESVGGGDTSRLTARQRARQGDGGFGEHLMMLPEDSGKKVVLSDLEKQARKEENARRRKLQMDQKMENDRNDVINRLLKAQTGKTRRNVAQTEGTPMSGNDGDEGNASADAKNAAVVQGLLRFVSSIRSGKFEMFVSAPQGKEQAITFEDAPRRERAGKGKVDARCGVAECGEKRKYRSVLDFEKGGCSMPHLKLVEQSLREK